MRFAATIRTTALGLAGLLTVPVAAQAEGWTISDLGSVGSRDECMDRARSVTEQYSRQYGGGFSSSQSWTHYLYDVRPGENHIVIMCPIVGGGTNAFLVTHGVTTESERQLVHDRLEMFWDDRGSGFGGGSGGGGGMK